MAGQWIDIPTNDGDKFRGYLTLPASGKGPAIVLCQEIFGINEYIRDVAGRNLRQVSQHLPHSDQHADQGKAETHLQKREQQEGFEILLILQKAVKAESEYQGFVQVLVRRCSSRREQNVGPAQERNRLFASVESYRQPSVVANTLPYAAC